jgi:hypothetical protein
MKDTDGKYKWVLLALLAATYFLAQGTRQIYNAVLPQIQADFAGSGLTDAQLGPAVLGFMNAHFSMSAGIASLSAFAFAGAAVIAVARVFFFSRDKV